MRRVLSFFAILFTFLAIAAEPVAVYKNKDADIETRVSDLISRMTLEEKIEMLGGTGFATKPNDRLGIPEMKMTDGPVGVRWGQSTSFGSGMSMAATFNRDLIRQTASAMALETRAKGRDLLLGPCVGISRVPFGGRNFEGMGEDPFLTSEIAAHYIRGMHEHKVVGSVKHFALNDQEHNRMTIDSIADERTMYEIHFPAFERAVKENVGTIMASYNLINGKHATENPELLSIPKEKWGFKGFIISDWDSTHSVVPAAMAGLDLEMPYGRFFGADLLKAVQNKQVPVSVIDDKLTRIFRVMFGAGLFDGADKNRPSSDVVNSEEHQNIALQLSRESHVLLKNNGVLPLDFTQVRKVAMIGPNAATLRVGGGGSSRVEPVYTVPPLRGLRNRAAGKANIVHARGVSLPDSAGEADEVQPLDPDDGDFGFVGEYFNNITLEGEPVFRRVDPQVDFGWDWGNRPDARLNAEHFSARWMGKFVAPFSGEYEFKMRSDDGTRIWINDTLIIDDWNHHGIEERNAKFKVKAGEIYQIKIEYFNDGGNSEVRFGWHMPAKKMFKHAVKVASESDVAVVNVGFAFWLESEAGDRYGFQLPAGQDELIQAVVKANPNTIVVINTGNPVDMSRWVNKVAGIIYAWFPGQEGGNALADILVGNYNPSGRLPVTMLKRWEDSPAYGTYPEQDGKAIYKEGIYVGYRYFDKAGIAPNFPFGHGLSYTTFRYDTFEIKAIDTAAANPKFEVSLKISNTGNHAGSEVVQIYVQDEEPRIDRPVQELKGFEKIDLAPGESKLMKFILDHASFAFYDVQSHGWKAMPGRFTVRAGSSSRDIRVTGNIELTEKAVTAAN